MIQSIFSALILIILCEGIGAGTKKLMKVEAFGFSAPMGFAVLLTVLELLYFPYQLSEMSFMWVRVITAFVIVVAFVFSIINIQEVIRKLLRWRTLIVVAYTGFFVYTLLNRYGTSDVTLMSTNFDVFRFQAYYGLMQVIQETFTGVFGCTNLEFLYFQEAVFYTLSSMLIINIVFSFHLRNKWLAFCICVFLLFGGNYTSTFASSGEAYRLFFVTVSVFTMYAYIKEGNEQIKYLLMFTMCAGMGCSHQFVFLSFELLYCFMVYLFEIRKIRSLFDLFTLAIPMVFFLCMKMIPGYPVFGWILIIAYCYFLWLRYQKKTRRSIARTEEACFDRVVPIFLIAVPVFFFVLSLVLRFVLPQGTVSYLDYFQEYPVTDTVSDQLFLHSSWLGWIVTGLRWLGVVVTIYFAKKTEDRFIRTLMIVMLVIFLNPLNTIALTQILTGSYYYRGFDILFNPLTLMILLSYIYKFLEWQTFWQWVMELFLLFYAFSKVYPILLGL